MIARHVLRQGPVIGTLGRIALGAIRQRILPPPPARGGAHPAAPGPELTVTVAPRDPGLVHDYVRWCGGDVDDDGGRAVLHQRLVTGTGSAPGRLVSHLYAIVPLAPRDPERKASGSRPTVPADAREIGRLELAGRAGFEFACLTGDFNPVHWIAPYG